PILRRSTNIPIRPIRLRKVPNTYTT
ncbi:hypothetical protein MPH_14016, partial [Macrophomina phaseolina MS6]